MMQWTSQAYWFNRSFIFLFSPKITSTSVYSENSENFENCLVNFEKGAKGKQFFGDFPSTSFHQRCDMKLKVNYSRRIENHEKWENCCETMLASKDFHSFQSSIDCSVSVFTVVFPAKQILKLMKEFFEIIYSETSEVLFLYRLSCCSTGLNILSKLKGFPLHES